MPIHVAGSFANLARALEQMTQYETGFMEGVADAQLKAAQKIYDRSQIYCPIDTGSLRASATVTQFGEPATTGKRGRSGRRGPSGLTTEGVMVTYGGAVAPYSTIVHENLDAFHLPPTQAKFLQRAVEEIAPQMNLLVGESAVRAARAAML